MVTLYTWESERGAPQVRIVPLPFAERASVSGFYYGTKAVSESGAVLWDSRED
ncbi:DUF7170 family protein [Enterobacter asburiae]